MPAVSGSLQNLINGVSRQPMAVRLPTQLDEQINGTSTPSRGHQKRPPTFHVKGVGDDFPSNIFTHDINRDLYERYHVLVTNGDLKVFDKSGTEKLVAFPTGKAYLEAVDPVSMFAATTSADHTFITNRTVTVGMDPGSVTTPLVQEALVFVRAVNFAKEYKIWINDTKVAHYLVADGVDGDRPSQRKEQQMVTPINVTKALFWGNVVATAADRVDGNGVVFTAPINGWTAADGAPLAEYSGSNEVDEATVFTRLIDNLPFSDWDVRRYSNVLYIKRRDGTPFTIKAEGDRQSGQSDNIIAIKEVIQDFTNLPNHGPEGFVVEVAGQPTDGTDNYWVRLTKPEGNDANDNVVWRECPKPNTLGGFDAATMPHILRREANGTFTFTSADWTMRRCGDDEQAPAPSFVGGNVNDVFFHRGRLGFLCDESVILTRPGLFFDFWRLTMTTIADDDPIDVAGTDDVVSVFQSAVAFDEELFLISDQAVHRLEAGELLTQKTVKLVLTSQEPIDIAVAPVATARSIFFLAGNSSDDEQVNYSDVRELYFSGDNDRDATSSVSDHVPGYISRDIRKLLSSPTNNLLMVLPRGTSGSIFIYQYFWAGDEKLQSAWHRWELGDGVGIIGGAVWGDEVHLVLQRSGATYFERIPVKSFLADVGKNWMVRLDRRVSTNTVASPTYDAGTDRTTFVLPYAVGTNTLAVYGPTSPHHGTIVPTYEAVDHSIILSGDHTESDVIFGKLYEHRFRLNELYVRGSEGQPMQTPRFQLLRLFAKFVDTAHFVAEVIPRFKAQMRKKTYSPYTGVDAFSIADTALLRSGQMGIPVNSKSDLVRIEIVNATHLPASFTGIEWEGIYVQRSRRIA